jgi:CelD/BcsL family acetyltransferase involved in cellulose biosynthesis
MKIHVVRPHELGTEHRARWLRFARENSSLESPYFRPEFTVAAASVRDDVYVSVLEDEGHVIGYFPFQRGRLGQGAPVGGHLSDYHGVIAGPEATWDVPELLRGSRLSCWEFDHLVLSQAPFGSRDVHYATSPALDLSEGFAAYKRRRVAASRRVAELDRKARKLAREIGPLRFVPHTEDRAVLSAVFAWKSEQCQRTGTVDFFDFAWTRELVERILTERKPHFSGELSALYAGDTLVAAHLGMRSERVFHWWFPVYNRACAKHSPGALLLLKVAEEAAARGCRLLDLGKGDDQYKATFADTEIPLAEGCAERPSLGATLREFGLSAETRLRASPLVEPFRPALRVARRWMRLQSYA